MTDNYCSTCKRHDFHWGGCADQNALLDYPYGKHPIPYPPRENKSGDSGGNLAL